MNNKTAHESFRSFDQEQEALIATPKCVMYVLQSLRSEVLWRDFWLMRGFVTLGTIYKAVIGTHGQDDPPTLVANSVRAQQLGWIAERSSLSLIEGDDVNWHLNILPEVTIA